MHRFWGRQIQFLPVESKRDKKGTVSPLSPALQGQGALPPIQWCGYGGRGGIRLPNIFLKCKKVGQKSPMLQEKWS